MADPTMAVVLFGGLIGALLLGIPVGYALAVATALGLMLTPIPPVYLAQTFYTGVGLFPLIAIPGFILAGELMARVGLTDRIIRVVYILTGNVPGGLAVVTIISCMFFASMTGSGPATTAAVGSVMIPAMVSAGYSPAFGAAVAASGGALGILMPPSNPMIIYGVVANVSVAGLFFSGIVPAVLLTATLTTYCIWTGRRRGYGATGEAFRFREFGQAVWLGLPALIMPILVLGSIYLGVATPTEASILAAVYTLLVGTFTRRITLSQIMDSMVYAGRLTGAVLIIMGPAMAFGKLMTLYEIPAQVSAGILGLSDNWILVLLLIGLLLVFIGMFMETLSTIVLLTPVFLPVLAVLAIDPVHFGILFVVLSEVGFLTPPLGVNLYVASAISKVGIEDISLAVLPFVALFLIFAVILIVVPEISTWGYYRIISR